MEKYVDVEAVRAIAHDYLCVQNDEDAFMAEIDDAAVCVLSELEPQEDIAPVRRGAWVDNIISVPGVEEWGEIEREIFAPDYKDGYKCSLCGEQTDRRWFRFCPRCGARMDIEETQ